MKMRKFLMNKKKQKEVNPKLSRNYKKQYMKKKNLNVNMTWN